MNRNVVTKKRNQINLMIKKAKNLMKLINLVIMVMKK